MFGRPKTSLSLPLPRSLTPYMFVPAQLLNSDEADESMTIIRRVVSSSRFWDFGVRLNADRTEPNDRSWLVDFEPKAKREFLEAANRTVQPAGGGIMEVGMARSDGNQQFVGILCCIHTGFPDKRPIGQRSVDQARRLPLYYKQFAVASVRSVSSVRVHSDRHWK